MGRSGIQKGMRCSPTKREAKITVKVSYANKTRADIRDLSEADKLKEYNQVYNLRPTHDHEEKAQETYTLLTKKKIVANTFMRKTLDKRRENAERI